MNMKKTCKGCRYWKYLSPGKSRKRFCSFLLDNKMKNPTPSENPGGGCESWKAAGKERKVSFCLRERRKNGENG